MLFGAFFSVWSIFSSYKRSAPNDQPRFSVVYIIDYISDTDFHLIDELQQVILGGVHAHCPHGPAQLLGADVSTSVNVKLIERLQQ